MTKEIQTKRQICLSDSLAAYAKSISPKSSISDGIRIALIEHQDQNETIEVSEEHKATIRNWIESHKP